MTSTSFQALLKSPFFRNFPITTLEKLNQRSSIRRYKKNSYVINLRDEAVAVYLLIEGAAAVYTDDSDGNKHILNTIGSGDMFGELGVIDSKPRTANVITTHSSDCLVIPKTEFLRCVFESSETSSAVMKILVGRIRYMTDEISCLAMLDVYARMIRLIRNSIEFSDGDVSTTGRLTHQEIASRIGSSREMVSKIIKDLTMGGYLKTNKQRISLLKEMPDKW